MNKSTTNFTVNWHFTPLCNMHCQYCFVPETKSLTEAQLFLILEKLNCGFFNRINFVGGEPTISKSLLKLTFKTKLLGMKTSIVTNGYRMIHDYQYADNLLCNLDMVGLSIDSLNPETNCFIGRECNNQTISQNEYKALCLKVKQAEKILKVNTVVSKANLFQDFNSFFKETCPDRIKLFQILEPNTILKKNYKNLLISEKEFMQFVRRHSQFLDKLCVENNNMMINSYILLNSEGRFCDNKTGATSPSLLEKNMTVEKAMKDIYLDIEKYNYRYK